MTLKIPIYVAWPAEKLRQGWASSFRKIRVLPGPAAEKIGLQPGDRLVSINGKYLPDHEYTYERDILSRFPGENVTIEYLTNEGRKITIDARLDATP